MTNSATTPSLSNDLLIQAITNHGLMVRQIPNEVVSKWRINPYTRDELPADAEIEIHKPSLSDFNGNQHAYDQYYKNFPNGRELWVERRIPTHAGYWLTKKATHTSTAVQWSLTDDCLAPTLNESVALWLQKEAVKQVKK